MVENVLNILQIKKTQIGRILDKDKKKKKELLKVINKGVKKG